MVYDDYNRRIAIVLSGYSDFNSDGFAMIQTCRSCIANWNTSLKKLTQAM